MPHHFLVHECALALQYLDDMLVGGEYVHACKQLGIRQEAATAIHRIIDRQAIATADDVIILTMPGCGVHTAGTGI